MERRKSQAGDGTAPAARERPVAVAAARRRSMAHRLELALGWDELAAELRAGLRRARDRGG